MRMRFLLLFLRCVLDVVGWIPLGHGEGWSWVRPTLCFAAGPTASPLTHHGFSPSDGGKWRGMRNASYAAPGGAFGADVAWCSGHSSAGSGSSLALQTSGCASAAFCLGFARGKALGFSRSCFCLQGEPKCGLEMGQIICWWRLLCA